MKVLLINGSPKKEGNTFTALDEMRKIFVKEDVEAEIVTVGGLDIRGCAACGYCHKNGKCVFNDIVNELAEKFKEADGLVVGSPVYYASANGTLVSLLDRLFYSSSFDKSFKVGASVAVARRGGCSSTFDELNKYFTISQMPIVSSQYWNMVHGNTPAEVRRDLEGMQGMRTLARNMVYLIRCIEAGKAAGVPFPKQEQKISTNFIR